MLKINNNKAGVFKENIIENFLLNFSVSTYFITLTLYLISVINISFFISFKTVLFSMTTSSFLFLLWFLKTENKNIKNVVSRIMPHIFIVSILVILLIQNHEIKIIFILISFVSGSTFLKKHSTNRSISPYLYYIFLFLLIFLALFLRINHIFSTDIWIDEATSLLSGYFTQKNYYPIFPSGFFYYQSLLHTYTLSLLQQITQNLISLKIYHLIIAIIGYIYLYFYLKKKTGDWVILFTFLFISLSPYFIFYDSVIRFYPVTLFLLILIISKIKTQTKKEFLLLIFLLLCGILTSRFFIIITAFIFVYKISRRFFYKYYKILLILFFVATFSMLEFYKNFIKIPLYSIGPIEFYLEFFSIIPLFTIFFCIFIFRTLSKKEWPLVEMLFIFLFLFFSFLPWKAPRYIYLLAPFLIYIYYQVLFDFIYIYKNKIIKFSLIVLAISTLFFSFKLMTEISNRSYSCIFEKIQINNDDIVITTAPSIAYYYLLNKENITFYWIKEIGVEDESIQMDEGRFIDPLFGMEVVNTEEKLEEILKTEKIVHVILDEDRYSWYIKNPNIKNKINGIIKYEKCHNIIYGKK
jgi:hypothetical protein